MSELTEQTEKCVSHFKKGFQVLVFGLLMVVIVNAARWVAGDIDHFQIAKEGLNVLMALFAVGAGLIAWFCSNPDRGILWKYVLVMGAICIVVTFFAYDKNYIVLIVFGVQVLLSSLMVAKVRVKYP